MADFRPFSPRWGDISFTEAPQTTARCYAEAIFLSYSPSDDTESPPVWRAPRGMGPGRGAGGRRQGQARQRVDAQRRRSATPAPLVWRAWLRCPWAVAGPGRASARTHTKCRRCGGRRRVRRARAGFEIDHSEPQARVWRSRGRPGPTAPGTPAAPHATTTRVRQRGGYRSTRPLSAHSATASSRLRPNDPQSWRRRRIHRNMPPTTAAPRPAPPIRPSKPVRARPFFGLVAGTSGAT